MAGGGCVPRTRNRHCGRTTFMSPQPPPPGPRADGPLPPTGLWRPDCAFWALLSTEARSAVASSAGKSGPEPIKVACRRTEQRERRCCAWRACLASSSICAPCPPTAPWAPGWPSRSCCATSTGSTIRMTPSYVRIVLSQAFDALIFIEESTATVALKMEDVGKLNGECWRNAGRIGAPYWHTAFRICGT